MRPDHAWRDYPAEVPAEERAQCCIETCTARSELVLLDHGSVLGAAISPRSAFTATFCLAHATEAGYAPESAAQDRPAPTLNGFQRWVVGLLGRDRDRG